MNIFAAHTLTFTATLLLLAFAPHNLSAKTEPDGCFANASRWIAEIETDKGDILSRHAKDRCLTSGSWLGRAMSEGGSAQKSTCNDLVLVWTHKACIYFRDDIHPDAYAPCKVWSREMYQRCLAGEGEWFAR